VRDKVHTFVNVGGTLSFCKYRSTWQNKSP